MLSATLEAGLSDYAIGGKIRALRLKKKMGLVELGQHSGLSPALLSKLERGRLFPTLNYETPDPDCPLNVVTSSEVPAGDTFININVSPQGQASAIVVRKHVG